MLAFTQSGPLYAAPLLGGIAGTEQTVWKLRGLIDEGWKNSYVNRTAIDIIRNAGIRPFDKWGQIRALFNWVLSNFYFVNDPVTKEALRPASELLELMAGDCDDINAIMLPSLLGTIGYETRLITIKADPEVPHLYSHIYVEVLVDGQWYPLDAAYPGAAFGNAPRSFFERHWWSLTDDSHGDYPASAPAGAMAGYARSGVRGLGDASSIIASLSQLGTGILRSIGGQTVQPVVGSTIGPGGAMSVPAHYGSPASSSTIPTWVWVVGGGLLAWKFL